MKDVTYSFSVWRDSNSRAAAGAAAAPTILTWVASNRLVITFIVAGWGVVWEWENE